MATTDKSERDLVRASLVARVALLRARLAEVAGRPNTDPTAPPWLAASVVEQWAGAALELARLDEAAE